MSTRKAHILLTVSILIFASAAVVYYAPISERALILTSTVTSQTIGTETIYTTQHITSKIHKVSEITTSTIIEHHTTVLR